MIGWLLLLGLACDDKDPQSEPIELRVFAAASLREAFGEMAKQFERAHPDVRIALNLASSSELRLQIEQGAKADVYASADLTQMNAAREKDLVLEHREFARNEPVLVVRSDFTEVTGLAELPRATRIAVATEEVPIGAYTKQILEKAAAVHGAEFRASVEKNIVTRELNVRHVLAKVTLGDADAGFVYRTDALTAGPRVKTITIPQELNVDARYPIAPVKGSAHPSRAEAFVSFVLSAEGQRILTSFGFAPAPGD